MGTSSKSKKNMVKHLNRSKEVKKVTKVIKKKKKIIYNILYVCTY